MFDFIIKFFKNMFKPERPQEVKTEEPYKAEPVKPSPKKTRVAIIVGHSKSRKGAQSYNGIYEFDYNSKVAHKIKHYLGTDTSAKVFFRDGSLDYQAAMKKIAKEVKAFGAEYSLELHFNAFHKEAYGCEILVPEDCKDFNNLLRIVDAWTDKLASQFNLKQRHKVKLGEHEYGDGIKIIRSGERGYYNLYYLAKYGIKPMLIEPMFANKKTNESLKFFEAHGDTNYAKFLVDRINEL